MLTKLLSKEVQTFRRSLRLSQQAHFNSEAREKVNKENWTNMKNKEKWTKKKIKENKANKPTFMVEQENKVNKEEQQNEQTPFLVYQDNKVN